MARQLKPAAGQGQLAALRVVDGWRLRRVTGGWRAPGSRLVTRNMVSELIRKGLVMMRYYPGHGWRPETTATGKLEIERADARRKRA